MLEINTRIKFNYGGEILAGVIYNVNEFREPSMFYAVDGDRMNDDFFFIGEDDIVEILEEDINITDQGYVICHAFPPKGYFI